MDYISTKEAAEKWKIHIRLVQEYCKAGRILGAKKYGISWMIPMDSEKPEDPRKLHKQQTSGKLHEEAELFLTAASLWKDGSIAGLDELEPVVRSLAEADLAYRRGNPLPAKKAWRTIPERAQEKLTASSLATAAAISSGDYALYHEIDYFLQKRMARIKADSAIGRRNLALLSLPGVMASVSMSIPSLAPEWLKECDFSLFPTELRPYLLYLYAMHLRNTGEFAAMLAVSRSTLLLCESSDNFTWLDVYLRVLCAMAAYALGKTAVCERYLEEALELGMPAGFLAPFADYVGNLGGVLEKLMSFKYPRQLKEIQELWNISFKNWMFFHNAFAKDHITTLLSAKEYQVAYLIAHGATYTQAAERMHLSTGRIKNLLSNVYETLFIHNKQELKNFIL